MNDKLKLRISQQYADLCQQLGDSVLKLDQLNNHITDLKSRIKALDTAYPMLASVIAQSEKELSSGEKEQ